MEYYTIRGKEYGFVSGFRNDDVLRKTFNALTRKVYGFDFEQWYQDGNWKDQYIPYSLADGDKIVANVSVNLMDFMFFGEQKRYIQLGTVMTDPDYRNQGLSRFLMEKVLKDYRDKSDLLYLFANDTVLDFYPKFGFEKVKQFQCVKKAEGHFRQPIKQLNMSNQSDRAVLIDKVNHAVPFSPVSMPISAELILFYCTLFMVNNVYYIEKYDAIVIADFKKDIIKVSDIFCPKQMILEDILSYLENENTKQIVLGFTPFESSAYEMLPLSDDGTMFAMGKDLQLTKTSRFMFPELSHT